MTDKLKDALVVTPFTAMAYAVGATLYEAIATKLITAEQAQALESRANELYVALLDGKVLTKQDDDTYIIASRETIKPDDTVLTIGGE